MPLICCVPECRGNYKNGLKVSVFGFPKDESLKTKWIDVVNRKDFLPSKFSRVCELHFEPSQILREASALDPKTGRILVARLRVPRLRKDAVPTIFIPTPGTFKTRMSSKKPANIGQKNKPKTVRELVEKLHESQQAKSLQTDLGTEFQTADETPCAIKQEPGEPINEPTQLIIGKVLCSEKLEPSTISSSGNPSSNSSSYASSISPVPTVNSFPISNPGSTNVDKTPSTYVLIRPAPKRKINSAKPDTVGVESDATQAKFSRHAEQSMPSKRDSEYKRQVPSGVSKKSRRRSASPTTNDDNATREIFQALVDGSENNPLFGSRTSERPGDLFDVFADFIADKLREMDWDDCAYALRAILDVVFKVGKVQHNGEVDSDVSSPNTSSLSSDEE